jgi:hypothetical protein
MGEVMDDREWRFRIEAVTIHEDGWWQAHYDVCWSWPAFPVTAWADDGWVRRDVIPRRGDEIVFGGFMPAGSRSTTRWSG